MCPARLIVAKESAIMCVCACDCVIVCISLLLLFGIVVAPLLDIFTKQCYICTRNVIFCPRHTDFWRNNCLRLYLDHTQHAPQRLLCRALSETYKRVFSASNASPCALCGHVPQQPNILFKSPSSSAVTYHLPIHTSLL